MEHVDERVKRAYSLAFEYESKYGNCPQCIVATMEEIFNFSLPDLFKAGHPLAGGLGLSGYGTCGALSGGAMILGYAYGRERKDFKVRTGGRSYRAAKDLYDKFVAEYGSCICRDVQSKIMGRSFNLWDPEDYKRFEAAGGHKDKCPDVVGKVAAWVAEQLIRQPATASPSK
jgi:C_GCAxxG_C_C family probable redox protein